MHTAQAILQTPRTLVPRSIKWKCGEVEMGSGRSDAIREGRLCDWSRQGLDASIALEQVGIITSTSIHALTALRSMVSQLTAQTDAILQQTEIGSRDLTQLDGLLEQLEAIVTEASLGDVNLLGNSSGYMNIPYLMTEIHEGDEYHNLVVMGMSITGVREDLCTGESALVGIYAITTGEEQSVCWLNAPGFYRDTLTSNGFDDSEIDGVEMVEQLVLFHENLQQFDKQLAQMEVQLQQYVEMVGEAGTDHGLE